MSYTLIPIESSENQTDAPVTINRDTFTDVPELASKKGIYSAQQNLDAGFAVSMRNAEKGLRRIENSGAGFMNMFGPTGWWDNKIDADFGNNPAEPGVFSRYLLSHKYKEYESEARRWMMGQLRKESGAAIPETEILGGFKAYFPMASDGPGAIKLKQEARKIAMIVMETQAGGAFIEAQAAVDAASVEGSALLELQERAKNDPKLRQKLIDTGLLKEGS
mgnify:FL=1